ncbi:hypothetical protein FJU30_17375 [Affinibrenneria salicis]|uniref:Uncharacterized protein n=1 Tax=Affinibrenneria salicis TaxID=2590031 RepID=A0A5J5FYP2_9GAMM|nr:hypothetical protein [Affinibrenneria salicis]KAA8998184.1 hypothetical protein FJU30_17375 [Affinibrenneria salicis]
MVENKKSWQYKIKSPHIKHAVKLSLSAGNSIREISDGWSDVNQVIYLSRKMSTELRKQIEQAEPLLKYWSVSKTPYDPAEEGFICNKYKVAMSFPKK